MQPTHITDRVVFPSFDCVSEPVLPDRPEQKIDISHAKSTLGSLIIVGKIAQIRAFFEQNQAPALRKGLSEGYTPLHIAADRPDAKIITLLLEYLPEAINAVNYKGNTPLIVAAKSGHTEVVRALLTANSSAATKLQRRPPPFWPPFSSSFHAIKTFLQGKPQPYVIPANQADIEASDSDGNTAVIIAIEHGHVATAKLLINMGADVNASNHRGVTPAMLTAATGDIDVLELLAANGADINAKDHQGHSALIYATCMPKAECDEHTIRRMVTALTRLGAEVPEKNALIDDLSVI